MTFLVRIKRIKFLFHLKFTILGSGIEYAYDTRINNRHFRSCNSITYFIPPP